MTLAIVIDTTPTDWAWRPECTRVWRGWWWHWLCLEVRYMGGR